MEHLLPFKGLPIGTRFRYPGQDPVWVIMDHAGCGMVAEWSGVNGPIAGQTICSAADTDAECESLYVTLAE